jgi:hypothetical protein
VAAREQQEGDEVPAVEALVEVDGVLPGDHLLLPAAFPLCHLRSSSVGSAQLGSLVVLVSGSPVLPGRAKWASTRHVKFGPTQARHVRRAMGCVWHGMSQRVMLGLPLQSVVWHGPAREAGGPLQHDGRHDSLVARPIKGMTHPGVLLWSCIKYYCDDVSSI